MGAIELRTGTAIAYSSLLGLYAAVGWTAYGDGEREDGLEKAVLNSSFVVSAWDGGQLVGLARALSDDVSIFYLQDILVHPDYQRQGIGTQLMNRCLRRFRHVRSKVLMTDDEERQRLFYETSGFQNLKDLRNVKLNMFVQIDGVD